VKKLILLGVDLITLYSALALVLLIRYGTDTWTIQWGLHTMPFTVLFAVWLLSFYIATLYDPRVLRNNRDFFSRLAQAVLVASGLSILFFYLIPYYGITPKLNLLLFILSFIILATGVRALANKALAGGSKKRLLIVGATEEAVHLARYMYENPQLGWNVRAMALVGQGERASAEHTGSWQMLDEHTDLSAFIREQRIDMVVISPQAYGSTKIVTMLYGARGQQVDFSLLASFAEEITGMVPLGAISQQWFLENISENSKKPYEAAKRALDIGVAVLLGIPALAVTPFIVAAIWLGSPGYPFLHQRRTGLHGQPFTLIKFRSMVPDAEKHTGAVWSGHNDPRITRVGNFLRTTRLDELPQLWNILRGDMSLIGPRAERPEIDAGLARSIPFYLERYFIKPGLSGWAQINYPYVSTPEDAIHRLEHDLYYIKHRSLGLDIEIILKTINISLRRAGR
jgi:exopolysaccharide biosynthesis polyprenyl glycosylphosphotransferase